MDECLQFLREGDALVVTKPDRLARSTAQLLTIEADLTQRGVGLVILGMGGERLDTGTDKQAHAHDLAGVATGTEIMLERQREGIAKAAAEGKYKGCKPTARAKATDVRKLASDGVTREEIARQLGIGVASVYCILAEQRVTRHRRSL